MGAVGTTKSKGAWDEDLNIKSGSTVQIKRDVKAAY